MDDHKLFVRLGTAVFKASGSKEDVQEQYDKFLAAVTATAATVAAAPSLKKQGHPAQRAAVTVASDEIEDDLPDGYHEQFENDHTADSISEELLKRGYRVDGTSVSLRVLPDGDRAVADSILLLIFGFQTIRKEDEVSSIDLMEAARRSGMQLDRADRIIGRMGSLVRRGGRGKGTRYQLTNPGLSRAEGLLQQMFAKEVKPIS